MPRKEKKDKFDDVWDEVSGQFDPPDKIKAEETTTAEEMYQEVLAEEEAIALESVDKILGEADEGEDLTDDGTYQLVEIDEILSIENKAMFETVEPKLIEKAEAKRLRKKAGELVEEAVSGKDVITVRQMQHWQRIRDGKFPWGWRVEEE